MSDRYRVTTLPGDHRKYAILDRDMWGFCTLPDDPNAEHPNLLPLEWNSRPAAEAWLHQCYRAWQNNTVPAPARWRPLPPAESPWA